MEPKPSDRAGIRSKRIWSSIFLKLEAAAEFAQRANAKSLSPENENASPEVERHFLFWLHFFMNVVTCRPSATHEYF